MPSSASEFQSEQVRYPLAKMSLALYLHAALAPVSYDHCSCLGKVALEWYQEFFWVDRLDYHLTQDSELIKWRTWLEHQGLFSLLSFSNPEPAIFAWETSCCSHPLWFGSRWWRSHFWCLLLWLEIRLATEILKYFRWIWWRLRCFQTRPWFDPKWCCIEYIHHQAPLNCLWKIMTYWI